MKSTIGKNIKITVWGGSHEPAVGVDIEGIPKGTEIDLTALTAFLKRRAPGRSMFATGRKEPDIPVPLHGLELKDGRCDAAGIAVAQAGQTSAPDRPASDAAATDGDQPSRAASPAADIAVATGETISLEIKNKDARSSDYKALRSVPRPGHADYTARIRYGDHLNMAGGGPFSARMTAPLCMAGGIALQILEQQGITVGAHIYSIEDAADTPFDPVNVTPQQLDALHEKDLALLSDEVRLEMQKRIAMAREEGDSVGGIVEACVLGLPAGIGGAMYDGLESALAPILFGIPAVKGVEFGAGFGAAKLKGSENNDAFYMDDGGGIDDKGGTARVKTRTNNHGGILGGITTGMPLITRVAFKPTPSIRKEQDSVDLEKKENTKLIVTGRHDPCVVTRAVPIVEAALALGILDSLMELPAGTQTEV
ncbi:MAG: chorismate synthase [Bacillota bacterium]|nr:chorismate synthase [Bacillota bacterium]